MALLPVTGPDATGLVVITRTIEPQKGGAALPGGFIDHGEDWRTAVVRELRERPGSRPPPRTSASPTSSATPTGTSWSSASSRPAPREPAALDADRRDSGHTVLYAPRPLTFPLHTEAANAWFAGRYSHR